MRRVARPSLVLISVTLAAVAACVPSHPANPVYGRIGILQAADEALALVIVCEDETTERISLLDIEGSNVEDAPVLARHDITGRAAGAHAVPLPIVSRVDPGSELAITVDVDDRTLLLDFRASELVDNEVVVAPGPHDGNRTITETRFRDAAEESCTD